MVASHGADREIPTTWKRESMAAELLRCTDDNAGRRLSIPAATCGAWPRNCSVVVENYHGPGPDRAAVFANPGGHGSRLVDTTGVVSWAADPPAGSLPCVDTTSKNVGRTPYRWWPRLVSGDRRLPVLHAGETGCRVLPGSDVVRGPRRWSNLDFLGVAPTPHARIPLAPACDHGAAPSNRL